MTCLLIILSWNVHVDKIKVIQYNVRLMVVMVPHAMDSCCYGPCISVQIYIIKRPPRFKHLTSLLSFIQIKYPVMVRYFLLCWIKVLLHRKHNLFKTEQCSKSSVVSLTKKKKKHQDMMNLLQKRKQMQKIHIIRKA